MREYLTTPDLKVRLVALLAYSPDFKPDEAIWNWIREDVTASTCLGTAAKVREKVDAFFGGLAKRTEEVKQRCRRDLQVPSRRADRGHQSVACRNQPCRSHLGISLARRVT